METRTTATAAQDQTKPALAGLFAVALIWGVNWPVMKIGIAGLGATEFALLRALLGALTMFIVTAALGALRWPRKEDGWLILHLGVMQTGVFLLLISKGVQAIGAGKSAILAYTTPIWVAPLSVLLLKDRLSAGSIAGAVLSLIGLVVLLGPTEIDWTNSSTVSGNLMLVAAALVWSLAIVHIRGHRWKGSPLEAAPWQLGIASVFLLAWWLFVEPPHEMRWSPEVVGALAFNGPLATGLAFWLMTAVGKRLPALLTSLVSLVIPVIGVATSAWALHEPITRAMVIGGALVLSGLLVSVFDRR